MKVKYEYVLYTWGGFYNPEYQEKHKEKEGCHFFDSKGEREEYLGSLIKIENELNARSLAFIKEEGYHLRHGVTAHRVTEFNGTKYYSCRHFPPGYDYCSAVSNIENKWFVGFNDYPMGDHIDYENAKYRVVQEWITGSFNKKPEQQ